MVGFYEGVGRELTLFIQQVAWLNAKPDQITAKGKKSGEITRLNRLKAEKLEPDLPPNPMPHLTGWLFEIGPTGSNGMGPVPLSWQEIAAWEHLTGNELDAWEAKTLRALSAEFVSKMNEAKDPAMPAPYASPEAIARNRDAVGRQITHGFSALKLAKSRSRVGGRKA